jgi:hypothetical protein
MDILVYRVIPVVSVCLALILLSCIWGVLTLIDIKYEIRKSAIIQEEIRTGLIGIKSILERQQ